MGKPNARMPRTRAEWQEAVDLAEFMLHLDACRQYGLIEGGPKADVERCELLLRKGRERGITPSRGCVERLTRLLSES